MQCLRPIHILKNSNGYRWNNPNLDYYTVPCGKCEICLKKKREQWAFRIQEETKDAYLNSFVTLTYADEYLPEDDTSDDLKNFLKSLRNLWRKYKDVGHKFSYMAVAENGDRFGRLHFHLILSVKFEISQIDFMSDVENTWHRGNVYFGNVTPRSIRYVAKYCIKDLRDSADGQIRVFTSKQLGFAFIEKNKNHYRLNPVSYVIKENGIKLGLPRTFKEKLLTREEIQKNADEYRSLCSTEESEITERQKYFKLRSDRDSRQRYINSRKQKRLK